MLPPLPPCTYQAPSPPPRAVQIEKEENTYVDKSTAAPPQQRTVLNTLGSPQIIEVPATRDHLSGAGAIIKKNPAAPPAIVVSSIPAARE